jgi:hypothetical protein
VQIMTDLNQQLDGKRGDAAQEAALRELIRVAVDAAFGGLMLLGLGGIKVRGNLVSYEPKDGR